MKDKKLRELLGFEEVVEARNLLSDKYEGFKEILPDLYNLIKNLTQIQNNISRRVSNLEDKEINK